MSFERRHKRRGADVLLRELRAMGLRIMLQGDDIVIGNVGFEFVQSYLHDYDVAHAGALRALLRAELKTS